MLTLTAKRLPGTRFGKRPLSIEKGGEGSNLNRQIFRKEHLYYCPATTLSDAATSAIIVSSKLSPSVSIGEKSLVHKLTKAILNATMAWTRKGDIMVNDWK